MSWAKACFILTGLVVYEVAFTTWRMVVGSPTVALVAQAAVVAIVAAFGAGYSACKVRDRGRAAARDYSHR